MKFKRYDEVKAFYNDVYGVLMRHEAQNLIPLGNVILGNEGKNKAGWRDPANWFMAAVSDGQGVHLTAVMTPPHNMTLYATDNRIDNEALSCLVNGLADYVGLASSLATYLRVLCSVPTPPQRNVA